MQDRQRVGLAGVLHVRRRHQPARSRRHAGVARHRLPQRRAPARVRLPRADRRGRHASPGHAELRRQHAFLAAFGADLAAAPASLPDERPDGVEDGATLRWAVRGPFLFLAWHQPHVPLAPYRGARFAVDGALLPSRPVDIPPGTLAAWPVGLDVHGVRLDWATASALTVLPGPGGPTLVLCAEEGVPVEVAAGERSSPPSRGGPRCGCSTGSTCWC
ncbi:hypothetical protein [Dactylosporangium darangshiense]|uniref:hypothetical protein n=1 Tax=Dactylosporangium darangshiense TaxID=579108 RepID=UPI0036284F0B